MNNSNIARNQFVAKRNDMIQQSRLALTLNQSKAVAYILSKIKKGDKADTLYEFNMNEFKNIMKLKKNSYSEIRNMLQNIADQSMYIRNADGQDVLIRWLNLVRLDPGSSKVYLSIHEDMAPYVFSLIEQKDANGDYFTTYKLQDIALMKHYYSPRIYEILKSYAYNNQQWKFEFGTGTIKDIQVLIAKVENESGISVIPKSWSSWAVFKRDVLEPAREDINTYTPMKIAYKESKYNLSGIKERKICSVEFYLLEKTNGEKKETEDKIEEEYKETDEEEYSQSSIFDEFFAAHKEKLEQEALNELIQTEDELEKRQESSICPLFLEYFQQFSDEEVEGLYRSALQHIASGIFSVKKRNWDERESWAIDYVTLYYDKIMATSEDTQTTFYKRLLDCVIKDYNDFSAQINEEYQRRFCN